jgi:hypothetical protein
VSDDIIIEEGSRGAYYPVMKRMNIGEKFVGGLIKTEQRDLMKKDRVTGVLAPVTNARGKTSQQLVVYLLVKESTMPCGTGENERVPERGEIVRALFDRGGFHQWIEARKELEGPLKVGTLIAMNTTHIVRFPPGDGAQQPCGEIRTMDELNAYLIDPTKRNENIGRRGDLAMRDADTDPAFKEECKTAYREMEATPDIVLGDPFPGPVSVGASSDLF